MFTEDELFRTLKRALSLADGGLYESVILETRKRTTTDDAGIKVTVKPVLVDESLSCYVSLVKSFNEKG